MGPGAGQLEFVERSNWSFAFPRHSKDKVAGAELSWGKEVRGPHLSLLRSRKPPQLHMRRKAHRGSKREGASPH